MQALEVFFTQISVCHLLQNTLLARCLFSEFTSQSSRIRDSRLNTSGPCVAEDSLYKVHLLLLTYQAFQKINERRFDRLSPFIEVSLGAMASVVRELVA